MYTSDSAEQVAYKVATRSGTAVSMYITSADRKLHVENFTPCEIKLQVVRANRGPEAEKVGAIKATHYAVWGDVFIDWLMQDHDKVHTGWLAN